MPDSVHPATVAQALGDLVATVSPDIREFDLSAMAAAANAIAGSIAKTAAAHLAAQP